MATSLSYREKSLYASLAAEVLVYGPYFFLHQQNSVNKVAGMIVAIIVLQVILQSLIAGLARNRITDERDYLRRRLRAMSVYTTDAHANFVYLPPRGRSMREVFDDTGLKARHYPDGAARITVGSRASTKAVLAAMATRPAGQIAS